MHLSPLLLSLFTTFALSAAAPPFPPLSGGPAAPSAVPAPWARTGDGAPSAAAPGSPLHPLLALAAGAMVPLPERGGAQPRSLAVQYDTGGWQVGTLAGSCASSGWRDGAGAQATFNGPQGIAVDAAGNAYVADAGNSAVRKVTPDGTVSTFAVSTGAVSFNNPAGIAVSAGGDVFVADTRNNRVCKVTPSGAVSVFAGSGAAGWADGSGALAAFRSPEGVAVDAAGNVFVGDSGNTRLRVITPGGAASTVAGSGAGGFSNGCGTAASFAYPSGVAVDAAGDVYVGDSFNLAVRKVQFGCVTTLAGGVDQGWSDGAGASASFQTLYGVAVDAAGNV
jgi:serine/threonine-protein kinase